MTLGLLPRCSLMCFRNWTKVSLVLQTPGADFGPAFLHSGEEAPSWTRSRSPLQCFCLYIFPCQEILYFMHQTALCTPGAWSSSAMLPDSLCWVRQHGTLQLCVEAGSWQLLARSLQCGVPKMSAPESLPEEGQKAKRANPRSHYRADGTRRRTKGEKKARQGQGAGAGYRSSGWTAEWWESGKDSWAQHPAEEEPAEQQTADAEAASSSTAGGATAETTGRAELPALDRAPPLDSRNSLLVRIPDGQGIPELREKLDAIRENSGLLHVLLSSKPKDGRWTLLLEGSKANQDKAKEQIMQIMVQAQREPPTTAQSASTEGADSPAPTQLQLVPPALPLSSPPGPRTAAEPALDDSPREPLSTSEPSVAVQQPPATDAGDTVVVQELQQQSQHSDRTVQGEAPSAYMLCALAIGRIAPEPLLVSCARASCSPLQLQGRTAHIFFTGALPQIRSGDRQYLHHKGDLQIVGSPGPGQGADDCNIAPAQKISDPSHRLRSRGWARLRYREGRHIRLRKRRLRLLTATPLAWGMFSVLCLVCCCVQAFLMLQLTLLYRSLPLYIKRWFCHWRSQRSQSLREQFSFPVVRNTVHHGRPGKENSTGAGSEEQLSFPVVRNTVYHGRPGKENFTGAGSEEQLSFPVVRNTVHHGRPGKENSTVAGSVEPAHGGGSPQQEHKQTDAIALHRPSHPGPKPGAGPSTSTLRYEQGFRRCRWLFWIFIFLSLHPVSGVGESRVEAHTSGVSKVGVSPTNTHASPHEGAGAAGQSEAHPSASLAYPWSAKRAFRRARARAAKGPTMYRGRLCTASELQAQYGQPLPQRQPRADRPQRKANHPARRVEVLTFNVSGLSSAMWQELQAWLATKEASAYDVIMLQETHWSQMSDFQSGPWHCVGTPIADKDKCSGLATLIHSRLGPAEAIQCKTFLKGRVTMTRVHQQFGALDVINVFQHVWRSKHTTAQNQASRASVYRAIGLALNASPIRNTCILGGDFNTEVRALSPHVGKALLKKSGHGGTEDGDEGLPELLQTHGLCLLNTWHGKHKATNVTSGNYSQIDFIAVRVQWADRVVKQSAAQPECPAGAWKTNRHFPVRASVKLVAPWHLIRKSRPANTQISKAEMQNSIAKQDARAQELREKVAADIRMLPVHAGLGQLTTLVDEILRKHAAVLYPAQPAPDRRISQHPVFNQSAKALWKLYREYKAQGKCSRRNILSKWRLWTRFRQASKQMRADVRTAKRMQIKDTMLELEQAARGGDQGGIYAAVRKLAPWKPAAKPSIRGKSGEFLTPAQQLRELCKHATEKFCQGTDYQPKGILHEGVQVTVEQLKQALQRLPIRKAAPPTAAPSALWRNSADELSELFWKPLSEAWGPGSEGRAPPIWKDANMVWMLGG